MKRVSRVLIAVMTLGVGLAFAGGGEVFDFNKEVAKADHEREAINRYMVRAPEYTVSAVVVNKEIPLHQHDDGSHVLYVVSGQGTATLDGQPVTLKAGTVVHIPKGVKHSITAKGGRITLVDFVQHASDTDQAGRPK